MVREARSRGAAEEPLCSRNDASPAEILRFAGVYRLPGHAQLAVALGTTLHTGVFCCSLPLPLESIYICQLFWFIHGWLTAFLKQWDANL